MSDLPLPPPDLGSPMTAHELINRLYQYAVERKQDGQLGPLAGSAFAYVLGEAANLLGRDSEDLDDPTDAVLADLGDFAMLDTLDDTMRRLGYRYD